MPRVLFLLTGATLATAVAAQAPAVPVARSALHAEIRLLNDSMEAAFQRGDMAAVASYYTDDARMWGPDVPEIRNRAAIDAYWIRVRDPVRWRLEVLDVGGSSALAYQVGRSHLTARGADGSERTYTTDFVAVWERQETGALRIILDLWK